ncbi:TIGR02453 family protein [Tropicibacter sp. R15_0]|uniref:TIGR02453 family protein n=1 Tax=Tropicibacter sp. R15_0 TaxID=2821101 RepID=UPI001ADB1431|nr:TIGR02453 family protein [Tropicibacter sp. R15_0]MBO9467435.1 TIGR02453 family protein [Tropicibacter sp. R15_0]
MSTSVETKTLFQDARQFLSELEKNNSKEWFQANKARYDTELKRPAERLLAGVAEFLEAISGTPPKPKLFRPHRDVRFSKDKTPYHTHLHLLWSLPDGRSWMLGIATGYATAGAGIMGFEKPHLEAYRAAVAMGGEDLQKILTDGAWRVEEPELKRVPAPYPSDHPSATLLRRKGLVAWRDDLEAGLSSDPEATLKDVFSGLKPVQDWLARVVS